MKTVVKKGLKFAALVGVVALSSACTTETISRAEPLSAPLFDAPVQNQQITIVPDYKVAQINVNVPKTLSVSEANSFKPRADIVWRDDPFGDRYQQVQAVVEAGLQSGAAQLQGSKDVILDVEIVQFHAQTEKARYTVGGKHEILFVLTVRDALSGSIVEEPRLIDATFDALGGMAALAADRSGMTQTVRITGWLSEVIKTELTKPITL